MLRSFFEEIRKQIMLFYLHESLLTLESYQSNNVAKKKNGGRREAGKKEGRGGLGTRCLDSS